MYLYHLPQERLLAWTGLKRFVEAMEQTHRQCLSLSVRKKLFHFSKLALPTSISASMLASSSSPVK